jgi:4'-phosphopantetheinyl transferase
MNLYLQNVSALPDPKENKAMLLGIPEWRKAKILKYLLPCDRKLSLGAWRLLEKALELNGCSAKDVTIDDNGKPKCNNLNFNLSHSSDMVLCTVGNVPIGCDIEKVVDAPFEVAEHYFKTKERQYIAEGLGENEKSRRFFRLWTMKESYLKMTGEGMSVSPERIEIDLNTLTVLRDSVPQPCSLQNFSLDNYEISICEYQHDEHK